MATQKKETLPIADGPSKFDLMVSLLDGTSESQRWVTFRAGEAGLEVKVSMLEREDGSGENWNFKGLARVANTNRQIEHVSGFFSTRTRKGTITFAWDRTGI